MNRGWYTIFRNVGWVAVGIVILLGVEVAALELGTGDGAVQKLAMMAVVGLTVLGIPVAVILGFANLCWREMSPSVGRKIFAGVFGSLGLLMFCVLAAAIGWMVFSSKTSNVDATCASVTELRQRRQMGRFSLEKLMPETARDVHFIGSLPGMFPGGVWARFRCKASEAEFLEFAQRCDYPLSTNGFRNVRVTDGGAWSSDEQVRNWWGFECLDAESQPANFLSYWDGYSNGGGLVLVFDRDKHVLYGNFAGN